MSLSTATPATVDLDAHPAVIREAVDRAPAIREIAYRAHADGLERVVWSGAGGASLLMEPAATWMSRTSRLPIQHVRASELLLGPTPSHQAPALVVMPSLSGTTEESVAAIEVCRRRGDRVVTMTADPDSPAAQLADHTLVVGADNSTSSETFYLQAMTLALHLLDARDEGSVEGSAALAALDEMPDVLTTLKTSVSDITGPLAEHLSRHRPHIISGAGLSWPEAHYYGMCILEEMQWIPTRPVRAEDFFHGTLELVDSDTSVVIVHGEDAWRPLTERVERFATTVSRRVVSLDSRALVPGALTPAARSLLAPVLLSSAFERVNADLEPLTGHALTTRRYYRRVDY